MGTCKVPGTPAGCWGPELNLMGANLHPLEPRTPLPGVTQQAAARSTPRTHRGCHRSPRNRYLPNEVFSSAHGGQGPLGRCAERSPMSQNRAENGLGCCGWAATPSPQPLLEQSGNIVEDVKPSHLGLFPPWCEHTFWGGGGSRRAVRGQLLVAAGNPDMCSGPRLQTRWCGPPARHSTAGGGTRRWPIGFNSETSYRGKTHGLCPSDRLQGLAILLKRPSGLIKCYRTYLGRKCKMLRVYTCSERQGLDIESQAAPPAPFGCLSRAHWKPFVKGCRHPAGGAGGRCYLCFSFLSCESPTPDGRGQADSPAASGTQKSLPWGGLGGSVD